MKVSKTLSVDAQCDVAFCKKHKQPPPYTANSQLFSNYYLQASKWKSCLSLFRPLLGCYLDQPKRFYDLKCAKCKNNIPAQGILRTYDTYALKANKGLSLGWRFILRKIRVHRCWKVFSALPQCADRHTKWTFSVDTFNSPKSTHWKNSNILATRPKVHNSTLKVKMQVTT